MNKNLGKYTNAENVCNANRIDCERNEITKLWELMTGCERGEWSESIFKWKSGENQQYATPTTKPDGHLHFKTVHLRERQSPHTENGDGVGP